MKTKLFLLAYILGCFSLGNAFEYFDDSFSEYQMIDIGVLHADYNYPIAINEQGQIIGRSSIYDTEYLFLWTKESGLRILDLPFTSFDQAKFNDLGQIVGVDRSTDRIIMWEPNKGSHILIEFNDAIPEKIVGFNNAGQLLISAMDPESEVTHLYYYDGINLTNLNEKLAGQFSGDWRVEQWDKICAALNGRGDVVFYSSKQPWHPFHENKGLFLFKDGQIHQIPTSVAIDGIYDFDDQGNILAGTCIHPSSLYVINCENHTDIRIEFTNYTYAFHRDLKLRNGMPFVVHSLQTRLVKQDNGVSFYAVGESIENLLLPKLPYIGRTISISDQNKKGWVLGSILRNNGCQDFNFTSKPTSIFLAIPKE
jgi:hypothetical protein